MAVVGRNVAEEVEVGSNVAGEVEVGRGSAPRPVGRNGGVELGRRRRAVGSWLGGDSTLGS